jgi:hypothetical protein
VRPPIVNVTPDRIGEALESLLDDRARTVEIAKESVAFAQEYHDGRRTAQVFADFLRP